MSRYGLILLLAAVLPCGVAWADDAPAKSYSVPYRLTLPKHVMVRAKINGKGPYNFILDTGAPALIVATPVCKKLGVKADDNGWGVFDRFELEGGLVVEKAKVRIETPFQLEGMNGMGLAGAEVHGMIGYDILSRFRFTIDFSNDKLILTPLSYKPKPPVGLGARGSASGGGLEIMGSLMKTLGGILGRKHTPETNLRGFLGLTLTQDGEFPKITELLADGPAAKSGLKVGDRITKVQGRTVVEADDVSRYLAKVHAGDKATITIERGKETKEIQVPISEGI
jgi:serine protease DegQ